MIFYECNRKRCIRCCYPVCMHTTERNYAINANASHDNYICVNGDFWQKTNQILKNKSEKN